MEKQCIKCSLLKDLTEFSTHKTNRDGYNNKCKKCVNEYAKLYREANIEKELARAKNYYTNNKTKKKEYAEQNKEAIAKQKAIYQITNKKKLSEYKANYYITNKERINEHGYEYYKFKMETDPLFKLKKQTKGLIRDSLRRKGLKKVGRTLNIIGCSFEEFKLYLESKFEPWMTWDNKGLYNGTLNYGWDIDHIIPVATAKTEEEILKLNHYTNLQPLCSKINRDIKRGN